MPIINYTDLSREDVGKLHRTLRAVYATVEGVLQEMQENSLEKITVTQWKQTSDALVDLTSFAGVIRDGLISEHLPSSAAEVVNEKRQKNTSRQQNKKPRSPTKKKAEKPATPRDPSA